ncbi:MAG: NAD+ synthase [Desulfobacteraceae bacterium 4484_190.1]|nr:MAG: NAD+ synthase [Desulfobacteraceae bacterium 4484_190.1]
MRTLRICLAQINTTVGDFSGNTEKILSCIEHARDFGVDIVTFPEMAVTGYPPEDLLLMPRFIKANLDCLEQIIEASSGICVITGFVDKKDDIYNSAAIIQNRELCGIYHKIYLPNYGVFDEHRYFQAGSEIPVFNLADTVIGINICEDIWYPGGPASTQALIGNAEVIVNISASPYHSEKGYSRKRMLSTRAADNIVIVAFNNLVGGQDELIFDGGSLIFDQKGELISEGKQFEEDFIIADLNLDAVFRQRIHDPRRRKEKLVQSAGKEQIKSITLKKGSLKRKPPLSKTTPRTLNRIEEIYCALTLGAKDYARKNGFKKVVIGLSGGIDSSIVAAIAVDAIGNENVTGVAMPSPFTSAESKEDALELARNLDIGFISIPIEETIKAYGTILASEFKGLSPDVTEENLQARIRGNILMALSNKFGWLVLTTGNKSETSVGYCTLYGDMAGGFAVIKDVLKTVVYELARYRNDKAGKEIIPERVLVKPPSAELRPGQKDIDSLPAYSVLDPVLQAYVEEDKDLEEIRDMGYEEEIVKEVIRLVNKNEYKRRQSSPGIKITHRALGKDRRLPISNQYRPV